MPNPTHGSLHVDQLLTDMSVAFVQNNAKFIARRVFPPVGVQKKSGLIPRYDRNDFLRSEVRRRQAGAKPHRAGYRVSSTEAYNCEEWSLGIPVTDEAKANEDDPFNSERDAVRWLTQQMMIEQDRQWVTSFFSTGNVWTGSSDSADLVAGTDFTAWSNAASNPIQDVSQQIENVESNTGHAPNKLVVNRKIWHDLKNHPDIESRINGAASPNSPAVADETAVAAILGVEEIAVAASVRSTEPEGSTSTSATYIAGDHALLVHTPDEPSLYMPAAGLTINWDGFLGGNQGQRIRMIRDDEALTDVPIIDAAFDMKTVATDLGVLFANASTR